MVHPPKFPSGMVHGNPILEIVMSRFLIIFVLFLAGCSHTPEQKWEKDRRSECYGLGGNAFAYVDKVAICSRSAFARNPKVLFKKKYLD